MFLLKLLHEFLSLMQVETPKLSDPLDRFNLVASGNQHQDIIGDRFIRLGLPATGAARCLPADLPFAHLTEP